MKVTLSVVAFAALLLGSTLSLNAVEPVASKKALQLQLFKDADANHDGKVTAQEFSNFVLTLVFDTYDKNQSGKISRTDYMAVVEKNPERKTADVEWKSMDPTDRGYITRSDYLKNQIAVNQMKDDFRKKLDKTGKGYITMADLPAVND